MNLPFHCPPPQGHLSQKPMCLGLEAMEHTFPQSNWFHQTAENRKAKKCRQEGRSIACLSKKEKLLLVNLISFSPVFTFNWKEGSEEYENALKDISKSPESASKMTVCCMADFIWKVFLILCVPVARWNFENGSGQSSPEQHQKNSATNSTQSAARMRTVFLIRSLKRHHA